MICIKKKLTFYYLHAYLQNVQVFVKIQNMSELQYVTVLILKRIFISCSLQTIINYIVL